MWVLRVAKHTPFAIIVCCVGLLWLWLVTISLSFALGTLAGILTGAMLVVVMLMNRTLTLVYEPDHELDNL